MPNITTTSKGGKIVWDQDDWIGGLHQRFVANPTFVKQIGSITGTLSFANSMNPFINVGYARPGFLPAALTDAAQVTGTMLNIATNDTSGYAVCTDTELVKVNLISAVIVSDGTWPHTITATAPNHSGHTGIVGLDVVSYSAFVTSQSEKIFYAWQDNTDWDIGVYDPVADAFNDDFMSTVPTDAALFDTRINQSQGFPHPLHVSDDDVILIGDRNFVHAFDGAATGGVFEDAVLTLPRGYVITSFANWRKNTLVFAYKTEIPSNVNFVKSEATVFLWDNLSLDWSEKYDLRDNYVVGAREYNDTVICFTSGRTGTDDPTRVGKLQIFNGVGFDVVRPFSIASLSDAPLVEGGVDIGSTGQITWNSQGTIYTWDSNYPELPARLNRPSAGAGTVSGLVRNLAVNFMLVSSGTGATGGAENLSVDTGVAATATAITNLALPPLPEETIAKINYVKVFFGASATGGRAVKVTLKNRTNVEFIALTGVEVVTEATMVRRFEQDTSGVKFYSFDALRCDIDWSAGSGSGATPIIDRIEVGYDNHPINAT